MNFEGMSLKKIFWRFVWPSVAARWIFALYTMVDEMFVARGGGHFPEAGQAAGGQSGQHPEHGGVCEALYFVTSACLQLWLWLSLFPKSWKDSGFTRRLYSGYSACHSWRWDLTLWGQDILRP